LRRSWEQSTRAVYGDDSFQDSLFGYLYIPFDYLYIKKHCENWRVSLVQNSTHIPKCVIEVIGENICKISSLKVSNNPPLAPVQPVPWKMGLKMIVEMQIKILNGGEKLVN